MTTGIEMSVNRFLLASFRFAPVLLVKTATPFAWIPLFVRLALLVAAGLLAASVAPVLPLAVSIDQPLRYAAALAGESVFGLCVLLAIMLPGAAIGLSARVIDIQSGVSAMAVLNPGTPAPESMAGTIMQWTVPLVFFALGFHLLLFQGLVASVHLTPLGSAGLALSPAAFLGLLGTQFLLGLAVSAPVILGLLAVDMAIAFVSRSMPQANIYFLALPLKVATAFLLLAADLRYAPHLVGRVFENAFSTVSASMSP